MFTLYKKELGSYLNNPVGYIVLVLFAILANFLFMKDVFATGSVSLKPFFALLPWLLLVFIPALSMRGFAEEKRTNTIEILLTLPITETQIVIAKFAALITIVTLGFLLTISLPLSFSYLSHIYLPEVIVGYTGSILLAASFIAISLFFSSTTKNQIVSFLISLVSIFVLLGITSELFTSFLPKLAQDAITYFGPVYQFQAFVKGTLDIRSIFFFISLTALFIFLTIIQLEKRD